MNPLSGLSKLRLATRLMGGCLVVGLSSLPAAASRLPSGRVVFDSPLQLVEIAPLAAEGGPKRYQVTIEIPLTAAEPLEALVIQPRDPQAGLVFDLGTTEVFLEEAYGLSPALPLVSVGGPSPSLNQLLLVLETPVAPGSTLLVVLNPQQPPAPGQYEVGITAYPAGADSVGQFLGYGQIQVPDRAR
jgi:hypothetical protein